jgi:hypothetical protein
LAQDAVTINKTIDHLTNHLLIREPNDKTILGSLVLVLGLDDELAALAVIRFALATTTKLDLETTKVRLTLGTADESLLSISKILLGYG